ncbi:helix-turn-helix transcriptional regulator [Sedimentimonas flavescens]|uniref:Helix-turn-helix transcriptional regulator n=1 Tax=Sedimentimonas flavescens TaxID=2851012 RepID=A0ABT2ZV57_9RHOB|nr:helix-turn-helix transcriptional regulator [Sedimentimonas flavescens]MCV2877636.1 helix-turn-helix transcriptional regulator [Sedimentimonas flavescens]
MAALRAKAGLTQRQVAEQAGIPVRTYQAYELEVREISAPALAALDEAMGWNPRWLLRGEGVSIDRPVASVVMGLLRQIELAVHAASPPISTQDKLELFEFFLDKALSGESVSDREIDRLIGLMTNRGRT